MIKIKGLHKHYKRNHVLRDINVEIAEPGIYAILGPNGSGKTTLLKSIIGLVIPEKGTISVGGTFISDTPLYRNNISYLPQIAKFPENLRIYEIIKLIKDIRPQEGDESYLIDLFKLGPEMKKRLGNLSGGTRQKVNMVLGLLFDTPLIILDEPTVSLDPVSLTKFKSLISKKKQQGKIILYTTHIMSLVEEFSDKILLLLDGKIIFTGGIKDILKESGEKYLESAITSLVEQKGND